MTLLEIALVILGTLGALGIAAVVLAKSKLVVLAKSKLQELRPPERPVSPSDWSRR